MDSRSFKYKVDEGSLDLKKVVNVIKRRFFIFAVITLLSVLVSGWLNYYILPPVYEAKTILMVTWTADMQKTNINTFLGQVKSDALMQRVINKMHLNQDIYTPRNLSRQIAVAAEKDSNLIEITVSDTDPKMAAEIANTLGREFMFITDETNKELVDRSVYFLRNQIVSIQKELAVTTDQLEKKLLEDTLTLLSDKVRITRSIDLGSTNVVVISPALRPVEPTMPYKQLNIAIAFVIGLMVSTALAFVKESLDNTIKTTEDVARHIDLPVLGVILHPNKHTMN